MKHILIVSNFDTLVEFSTLFRLLLQPKMSSVNFYIAQKNKVFNDPFQLEENWKIYNWLENDMSTILTWSFHKFTLCEADHYNLSCWQQTKPIEIFYYNNLEICMSDKLCVVFFWLLRLWNLSTILTMLQSEVSSFV